MSSLISSDSTIRLGRWMLLIGVILPLLMIGVLKFTQTEIDALQPIISGTPWLAWLYPTLGAAGTSYLLGVTELIAVALLLASPWVPRSGVAGGALAAFIFLVTFSTLLVLPVWETQEGGFPFLNGLGIFLIKDAALAGGCLLILGDSLSRLRN